MNRIYFLCITFFLLFSIANAQYIGVLENRQFKNKMHSFFTNKPKEIKLKVGKSVVYQLKTDKKKELKKGKITEFKKGVIKIDGKTYKTSQLSMIGVVLPGSIVKAIIGPVIVGSGLAIMGSGAYLGGYAIANYFNQPIILFEGLKVAKSYFVFRTIPGMLAGVVVGIGANVLGFNVAKYGAKTTMKPFLKTQLNLGKEWQLKILEVEEKKGEDEGVQEKNKQQ